MFKSKALDSLSSDKIFGPLISKMTQIPDAIHGLITRELLLTLSQPPINLKEVKEKVLQDVLKLIPSLRSLVWKILLNYIPKDCKNWEAEIEKKRKEYAEIKSNYFITLEKMRKNSGHKTDDPLSNNKCNSWNSVIKDNQLSAIIEKDLKRTRNELKFFDDKSKCSPKENNKDILKRILLIFAKRHPKINYVQGLNEILAIIYYCFSMDENNLFVPGLEADTYFCFEYLIEQIGDIFVSSLDKTPTGIQTHLDYVKYLLKNIYNELWDHLNDQKVDISTIIFRWYTLFFTQEFSIDGALHVMDFFLCNITANDKFDFLNMMCISVLALKQDTMMNQDYSEIINELQIFNDNDVYKIVLNAEVISNKYLKNISMKISNFEHYGKNENVIDV